MNATPLIELDDVRVAFTGGGLRRTKTEVLHGVSLDIRPGETHGLVGESGSGKTTIGRAILGLVPLESGSIRFRGERIDGLRGTRRRALATQVQVVFQDPYTSLNPSLTIGDTLAEPLRAQGMGLADARRRIRELLDAVALPSGAADRLPREFSGGQRQRVAIARALAIRPALIVCDEAVSALDLTTQRTVLELLLSIQKETGVSYLFISHDLSVVRHMSHRVSVIYRGDIVESGDAAVVTSAPSHPYSRKLLLSAPVVDPAAQAERRRQFESEFAGARR
ncbi:ATP-binding cassette domain-containing protein [Mycetocola reblochoni]|uniref:Oligopeptide transport ATP-binding protein OppF (TC 3.A.1.5.1) n=2 Tax=Mycetocola reblochoni TaxID=331618 RepID=A0A1R4J1D0_9MICO|nr:ATP-binding cassette domain-containing protein [Mycetocola reblochoni]RLP71222.1 ABC transporter ATP-binding protein [Mycetocola reblochoni]SJN25892.1 Oligopeptide transport ATP-binding protein OppF (TC 3.A.1.5.1) [Mycetocola reblochoni REB411]